MCNKIDILKNFAKFTRKHLRWNLLFIKFLGLQPATLFNYRRQRGCFPVFCEIFKNAFLTKHLSPTPLKPKFRPTPFF